MTIFGPNIESEETDPFEDEIFTIQYRDSESGQNNIYPRWDYDKEKDLLFDFIMDYKDITWSRKAGGQSGLATE
jgi:hypothetical protein